VASIDLTKLQPGKTYSVAVRAKDDDGNYSGYSVNYKFTTPSANLNGSQLVGLNSTVVTALAQGSGSVVGGALTAGGLNSNGVSYAGKAQLADVWNGAASAISSMTGTASTGAVIINSTGILGYKFATSSSGQAQFFLNTADGNAYFRGTLYAGAGLIGGWTIASNALINANVGMVATASGSTGELVVNGSFETGDSTGWQLFGTNVNVSSINPYSGSWNLSIRQDSICGASSTNYISVLPGNSYQLSAYMMTSRTSILGDLFIYWYNSASTLISTSSGAFTLTTGYARYILNATSPSNAAYAKVQVSNEVGLIGTFSADLISFTGTIVPSSEISFFSGSAYANRATAPFRVDYSGNLFATNASVTGYISSGSGIIGGWTINPSTLSGSSTTTNLIQAYDSSFENQSKYLNYWDTAVYSPAAGTPWAIQVTNIKNPYVGKNYLSTIYGFDTTLDSTNASTMFTMFLKSASAGTRFLVSDLGLTTGASYVFSAYVKLSDIPGYTNNATSATIYVGQYTSNTNAGPGVAGQSGAPAPISISSSTVTLTASWQRVSASFVAGSSSVSVMPFIGSNNPADGSAVKALSMIDIDAVQLESGTTPTAYNVGNYVSLSSGSTSLSTGLSSSITNFSVTNTGNVQAESINSGGIVTAPNIPFGVSTGIATFSASTIAAGSFITKTLSFPEGRFSVAPAVFTNIMSGGTNMGYIIPRAVSTTVYSTTIRLYNVSASSISTTAASISVVAVQQGTTPLQTDTMQ